MCVRVGGREGGARLGVGQFRILFRVIIGFETEPISYSNYLPYHHTP